MAKIKCRKKSEARMTKRTACSSLDIHRSSVICLSSFNISLALHAIRLCLSIDALEQTSQDAAGADFPEGSVSVGEHFANGCFPLDGRNDLLDEQITDFFGVVVRMGIDVGNDRDARLAQRDAAKRFFEA